MAAKRYTVCVDFDGVIHRYDTPWLAPHVIPDPPVEGAIEWLSRMVQDFKVVIFSTRAKGWRGRLAIRRWLFKHGGNLYVDGPGYDGLVGVKITATKPPALVYIDDRAYRFTGANFPSRQEIHKMKPWHKRAGKEPSRARPEEEVG